MGGFLDGVFSVKGPLSLCCPLRILSASLPTAPAPESCGLRHSHLERVKEMWGLVGSILHSWGGQGLPTHCHSPSREKSGAEVTPGPARCPLGKVMEVQSHCSFSLISASKLWGAGASALDARACAQALSTVGDYLRRFSRTSWNLARRVCRFQPVSWPRMVPTS